MRKDDYRPHIHFTPPSCWMNDPNGLLYANGVYHMFYQHNPYTTQWGAMHWGYATSTDLLHWNDEPIALYPNELGAAFSGSAVIDANNTSCLFPDTDNGIVLIYTHAKEQKDSALLQQQGIAYSSDNGNTWIEYAHNPVIPNTAYPDFRDPKVWWHAETEEWLLVLACNKEVFFYASPNLIDWQYRSSFGRGWGNQSGMWECPNMFHLPLHNNTSQDTKTPSHVNQPAAGKWVLATSITGGHSENGGATQYFVGNFDGTTFVPDQEPEHINQVDYGRDFYAMQTWEGMPKHKHLWTGWMSQWKYGNITPTQQWRGVFSVPRELTLKNVQGQTLLCQHPAAALAALREPAAFASKLSKMRSTAHTTLDAHYAYELLCTITKHDSHTVLFHFGEHEQLVVTINNGALTVDRSKTTTNAPSADKEFHGFFAGSNTTLLIKDGLSTLALHIIIDSCSVEVFAQDGILVSTDLLFPEHPITGLTLNSGNAANMQLYRLRSIWKNKSRRDLKITQKEVAYE